MTVRQKQLLLAYLGYYTAEIDGQWGPFSEKAARAFQRDYRLKEDGILGTETQRILRRVIAEEDAPAVKEPEHRFWDEIRFFARKEFACKCGKCGGFPVEPREELIRIADGLRTHFARPVIVSSGVRCKAHNVKVGGVSNSRHLSGKAMDFRVTGKSAQTVLAYVLKQPRIRYAYAIDNAFVHMDIE